MVLGFNAGFLIFKQNLVAFGSLQTYVLNSKGVEVFVKSWVPADEQLHGVVFLCHGYGDSVSFYAEGKNDKNAFNCLCSHDIL